MHPEDTQPTGDPDACFKPHHTLRRALVKVKNPTPAQQRAGVVYRITCGTCPRVYIGQTGRTLKHRLKEHKRALRSGETAQSAVAAGHAINEGDTIKWDDAEMVDHSTRFRQRCTLEAWHIRTEQHTMNRDEGPLPSVYNPLVTPTFPPLTLLHSSNPSLHFILLFLCTELILCICKCHPLASHSFPPYSPAVYVYKVCHLGFVSVNFTDEGPGLGQNVWNYSQITS